MGKSVVFTPKPPRHPLKTRTAEPSRDTRKTAKKTTKKTSRRKA